MADMHFAFAFHMSELTEFLTKRKSEKNNVTPRYCLHIFLCLLTEYACLEVLRELKPNLGEVIISSVLNSADIQFDWSELISKLEVCPPLET